MNRYTFTTMKTTKIRTASELKAQVERGTDRHYFERSSMSFFGDTMRNYGVRYVRATDMRGNEREAIQLYRKKPVKHGIQDPAYFDSETFAKITGAKLIG